MFANAAVTIPQQQDFRRLQVFKASKTSLGIHDVSMHSGLKALTAFQGIQDFSRFSGLLKGTRGTLQERAGCGRLLGGFTSTTQFTYMMCFTSNMNLSATSETVRLSCLTNSPLHGLIDSPLSAQFIYI